MKFIDTHTHLYSDQFNEGSFFFLMSSGCNTSLDSFKPLSANLTFSSFERVVDPSSKALKEGDVS